MTRNLKAPALVLKVNPVGENHRGLSMLVSGEGILRPFAYGAQGKRSTLRGTAVPYNRGVADLHYDGAKDRWRLTAFDPEDSHDGLRENLDRFYAATTWAEILLKTHGAGDDSASLFEMAAAFFSRLSVTVPSDIKRLSVGFMWQFLGIEGVQPDPEHCGRCGKPLIIGGESGFARFLPNGLLAGPECAEGRGTELSDGARRWLSALTGSGPEGALQIGLAPAAVTAAESWLLTIIQSLLERPLRSIRVY
ncbi:MAG: DNA repair protein RecO C-terminal domain-containing protein [Spirochaetaceae bacterium]|nr:DNA repair protein RecO C-terminal domain-containing protein [Spirochaetaceae bacterium]MDT8298912.1 DNA repair protein RecO C-terminal domain-containing protein [Spirochaetaceae bacterium]